MPKTALVVFAFAFFTWAFCGALIGIGRQFFTMETTLIIHAIGAPIGAAVFSAIYFRGFGYAGPLVTALSFVGVSLALDVFVVALLIERSFEMFTSVLGVWIPQALIFTATYLTGLVLSQPGKVEP